MCESSRELIQRLTLEEKCRLCGEEAGKIGRISRLGKSGCVPGSAPSGGTEPPVLFPGAASLGMSWDRSLVQKTGMHTALLCLAGATPVRWLFRPGVNLKRSPLSGRNGDCFSEDPVLTGELAGAFIQGLQENDVAAAPGFFLCQEQTGSPSAEPEKNIVISGRALREVYLRAFEIAIRKGAPLAVLTAECQINGTWISASRLLRDLLRKELGYNGVVVSEQDAINHNRAEACGLGMEDVTLAPAARGARELLEAIQSGNLQEADLDSALERVLDLVETLYHSIPVAVDMERLRSEAIRAAEQCMVLLQNNGVLPLSRSQGGLLAVGAAADVPWGGTGYRAERFLEALRGAVPQVEYVAGYTLDGTGVDEALLETAVERAKQAECVIVFAGFPGASCGQDRTNIQLPEGQRQLIDALTEMHSNVVLVLACDSVLYITPWVGKLAAILYTGPAGEGTAAALTNVLFGDAEPGGRLAETWPVSEEHGPAFLNFAREGKEMPDVCYGEGIYVGYRWYEKRALPVLYPFGHGLSYTRFELGQPRLSTRELRGTDTLTVTVPVRNIGDRPGSQVIQLYVSHEGSSICDHPVKELKEFQKVYLQPGESADVVLTLDRHAFEFFAPARKQWVLEDGGCLLCVGVSVADIHSKNLVILRGGDMV